MKNLKASLKTILFSIGKFFFIIEKRENSGEKKQTDIKKNQYDEYLEYYLKTTRWQNC